MNLASWIGRSLGYRDVSQIESWQTTFGASWAQTTPAIVWLSCGLAVAAAVLLYWRWQRAVPLQSRIVLTAARGLALVLLVLLLADPILELRFVRFPQPVLWLLVDGSDSMNIQDDLSADERTRIEASVGWAKSFRDGSTATPSRADYVRSLLSQTDQPALTDLTSRFRLKLFSLDSADVVTALTKSAASRSPGDSTTAPSGSAVDGANSGAAELQPAAGSSSELARDQEERVALGDLLVNWRAQGPVTAIGSGLDDLARRQGTESLAGLVIFSDFDQNAGLPAVAAARKLGVPIFPVGIGATAARDLAVDLITPPTMKRGETSSISVTVRQRELDQANARVRLYIEPLSGVSGLRTLVGERTLTLTQSSATTEFSFTPDTAARVQVIAEVDPVEGESVVENNRALRESRVIDDFLRLNFLEYEPTWEWRFIKEVFHRDPLVGLRGFRTYLRSADPAVRETNQLFLPTLTLPRREFFESDVIFLGDLPGSTLTPRFGEMIKEFVGQFGGGLVVMGGPRFGPGQLADTPLAEILPVIVDPDARIRQDQDFTLRLSPLAAQYDFMRLGEREDLPLDGWNALGRLNWYQPVRQVHPLATTVLAEHPTDVCADGKTRQPLIAIRKYGRGEVVYLAFNELWRLRRLHGEKYYRQFWGQLIHRLGLSHALGAQKRFVVRTDKPQYRADERVLVTVEAFDREFNPLDESTLPTRRLKAELLRPEGGSSGRDEVESLGLPQLRAGVFETSIAPSEGGEYRLRVTDPVEGEPVEIAFRVTEISAERRSAVRNDALMQELASTTGGTAYDLTTFSRFAENFRPAPLKETSIVVTPLWNTWLWFAAVVGLLLLEWFGRKLVNLP